MTTGTVLVLGAALFLGIVGGAYVVGIFNALIEVKNNISKSWSNIDVLLQQRHDELTKLLDVVASYLKHERDLILNVTRLRAGYDASKDVSKKVALENELNQSVSQLRHVWEAYPDLKSSQNFLQLQQRVSELETSIADRREFFNDSVNIYNILIEQFPHLILARMMRYRRHAFLEIPASAKADIVARVA